MTITAKNYAAQVERFCRQFSDKYLADADVIQRMANIIEKSVHFAICDNGRIMDDRLRGISYQDIRLPFPKITLEYTSVEDGVNFGVVIIAEEITRQQIEEHFYAKVDFEIGIKISSIIKHGKLFYPSLGAWILPSNWDSLENRDAIGSDNFKNKVCFAGIPITNMSSACVKRIKEVGEKQFQEDLFVEARGDTRAILELVEALSCSNVTHEPIEKINPAVNARRIRDGKLPIYETRCLVINAGKQSAPSGEYKGNSNHVSPRQHLRRGHIRRLPDKNIWVNSCVVGDKSNGVIDKSYSVTK